MKKLLVLLVAIVSLSMTAQVEKGIKFEFTRIHKNSGETVDARVVLEFKGAGADELKVFSEDWSLDIDFKRISEITEGKTRGGFKYLEAEFITDEGEHAFIQLFLDVEYGIRVVFSDSSYQFI